MRDFDSDGSTRRGARLAQDGIFKLGGAEFHLRRGLAVGSTALDGWRDVLGRMLADDDEQATWPEKHAGQAYAEVDDDEFVATFRATMLALLEPGQEAALDRVLSADAPNPVMIPDAFEVCFWAVGVVTGRPTAASMPSSNGSTPTGTEPAAASSTGNSSSPAAEESLV